MQNPVAGQVAVPEEVTGLHVEGDEAGGKGRRDVDVALIDAVAGQGKEPAIHAEGRAGREVVGEDIQLGDHVESPDKIRVGGRGGGFVGDRAVVLAVAEAFGVEAQDFGAIGDIVEAVAGDVRSGADALLRPVVDAAGRQLGMGDLPEERAVR